ncbi:polysaccharide deacetylase [Candidatus Berkelbacteria bacterium CG_4_9_14_0_2_um_filter_42_30]|uniref:Polysaccharide deacetylase n=3 Tax=Candidatus Berkelbacteria TaxID=1618330 RepID=A0A2H0PYD4_9BACT|nr:MAG: polysaccharide deacetylase [Candidatus Berkelbacteria bacterium CG11_big_fil_rev_8_21_14_0_20_42_15]PIZ27791.1 MAG: polysaccharide deacetylase [Candidatus Berkelbacteria bacterium CG_4_10_14_0_8_um_filter_42_34]PJC65809.1 MAG: polysaccharide deacetylase [Candidatus Berkelbacteria bacterium CG_4_9_14_0_2_um_filter_42_30]
MMRILKAILIALAVIVILTNGLILFLRFYWFPRQEAKKTSEEIFLTDDEIQPTSKDITQKPGYIYCPILLYHHIAKVEPQQSYFVSPATFDQQLKWLSDNGYETIRQDDLYLAMNRKKKLPAKPVIISFDDGDHDQYENALPILKKYGFLAVFYLKLNNIEKSGGMSWKEIKELRDAGMEIGSHTVNHDALTSLSTDQIKYELLESKKVLEDNLGIKIFHFAYPGGNYNAEIEKAVADAGYSTAASTRRNAYQQIGGDLYLLPRIHIDDEIPTFENWVLGNNASY